jgi:polyvinyl alcohol dehydrogenase (cytochrome)
MYGQGPARTMSTACALAPSPSTAAGLHPRWHLRTDDVVTATPTVSGGAVYVGDWSGSFYSIDLATGRVLWTTALGPRRSDGDADHHTGAYGTITSSAAVQSIGGRRMAFVGAGGSLYALDASTAAVPDANRVLWRTDLDPAHPTSPGEIESSPVVWASAPGGPVVIVGSDANQDSGYVGEGVWGIRAATGQVVWHFNPETYTHHALYGCGNVWSSPALDTARQAIYFGTADCPDNGTVKCPSDGSDRYCPPGQNYDYADRWQPYAESITAISATDGQPLWSYQGHPPLNNNDDDYGPSAQLFTLPDGEAVVGEAGKDGRYVVLDRDTGKLVWWRAETGNGNLKPGFALGGFIGTTALMDVGGSPRVFGGSAIDTPVTYDSSGNPTWQPVPTLLQNAKPMVSFSGTDGSPAWTGQQLYTYGPTAAANGVAYVGALDAVFRAYDAASGRVLWSFPLGAPISSGPAIGAGTVVIGDGTSESDVEFKTCDDLPAQLAQSCARTPLDTTLNPLSNTGSVWAFTDGS